MKCTSAVTIANVPVAITIAVGPQIPLVPQDELIHTRISHPVPAMAISEVADSDMTGDVSPLPPPAVTFALLTAPDIRLNPIYSRTNKPGKPIPPLIEFTAHNAHPTAAMVISAQIGG